MNTIPFAFEFDLNVYSDEYGLKSPKKYWKVKRKSVHKTKVSLYRTYYDQNNECFYNAIVPV